MTVTKVPALERLEERSAVEAERKTRLEPEAAPRTVSRLQRYPRLPDGRLPLGGIEVARPGRRGPTTMRNDSLNGCRSYWSGKRDSNSRPRPWQGRALPTELFPRWVAKVGNFSFSANFFSKKGFCPCHACTRAFPCPFHSLCFLPFDGAYGLLWHDWYPGVFPFAMPLQ